MKKKARMYWTYILKYLSKTYNRQLGGCSLQQLEWLHVIDAQTMAGMIVVKANHAVPYLWQEGQLPHCKVRDW